MITYRGYVNHNKAGARLVVVEEDGLVTGPLRHITKHSPDGFSWGYCGSGPAELARCLLIDALDLAPDCDQCDGEGRSTCWWCDGGYVEPVPAMYQSFKFAVIANLPDEWTLPRDEIRAWAATYRIAHPALESDPK